MRFVFDLETDGLLDDVSKVHCIVLKNIDNQEVIVTKINKAMQLLAEADLIIGHNIIKYDIPVLKKLYGFVTEAKIFDTIVAARLVYPDIRDKDFANKELPRKYIGSHSLAAYGHRLGNLKGDFDGGDWQEYSKEMLEYCIQDVEVTHNLYNKILDKGFSEQAMELEHDVVTLINKQELHGFTFDVEKAEELAGKLNVRRFEIEDELQEIFPPRTLRIPFIPKVNNKARGYIKGQVFYKEKVETFNPSSRQHIAERLKERYEWKPEEFTNDGSPKLDDEILSKLPFKEAKLLAEHFLLDKRIAQLSTGNQAWLLKRKDSKIHGTCNTNSTVTGRASHTSPNLGQIPSVSVPYGKECRELFTVPEKYKLVGIDISGLEVRMLAHFMSKYDNGAYSDVVLNGDIHTTTQKLAGLDSRDVAKRFYYCFLYGGGVKKISQVINKKVNAASAIKKRFLNNLPALNKLIEQVQAASERGYLIGLDKRQVKVRSAHSALNTLLQSAGAIVCKQWLVEFDKAVKNIPHVQQVVWVHDEIQVECLEKDAEKIGELAVEAIERTGNHFNLRIPLTGEFKIGNNWSETH
jgi:DNA polymerase-1